MRLPLKLSTARKRIMLGPNHKRLGFTLVELLTVIAIIAIMAALSVLGIGKIRDRAQSIRCQSNLHQIGLSALLYANDNRGRLPPIQGPDGWWPILIAPHLGMSSMSKTDIGRDAVFRCPAVADEDIGTNYAGVVSYGYGPVKPFIIDFISTGNPLGSKKLNELNRPASVWLYGDLGKPREPASGAMPTGGYTTVESAERPYGSAGWGAANQPACRHNGNTRANFVAADGHVESWTWDDLRIQKNSVFGYDAVNNRINY